MRFGSRREKVDLLPRGGREGLHLFSFVELEALSFSFSLLFIIVSSFVVSRE